MLDKSLTVAERERRIEQAIEDIFPLEGFEIHDCNHGGGEYRAIVFPEIDIDLPVSLLARELEKALS